MCKLIFLNLHKLFETVITNVGQMDRNPFLRPVQAVPSGKHVVLEYTDPGRLLRLLSTLNDLNSVPIQIKVNYYIQTVTNSDVSFMFEKCITVSEIVLRVIGTVELFSIVRWKGKENFIKKLWHIENPVKLKEEQMDDKLRNKLEEVLKDSYHTTLNNCMMFPIFNPFTKRLLFCVGIVNYETIPDHEMVYDGLISECYRYCHRILLSTIQFDEQRIIHNKNKDIMDVAIRLLQDLDNAQSLLASIRYEVCEILEGQKCHIFLRQGTKLCSRILDFGNYFDTSIEEHGVTNIQIPITMGIAGAVATTGKIINIMNTEKIPLYTETYEKRIGIKCRSLLSFPIIVYGGIRGVVEVYNKHPAQHFDKNDEGYAILLGQIFGICIHQSLLFKKLQDAITRRYTTDWIVLKSIKRVQENEVALVMNCENGHNYEQIINFQFLTSEIPEEHQICVILKVFMDYGLLDTFAVDRKIFIRFLVNIRNGYYDEPFRNWQHALDTFHFVFILIQNLNLLLSESITVLELFALLLAGLCHDFDYKGSTSPFQLATGTVLASLYSSPGSVAQYHTVSQVIRLMGVPECRIYENLTNVEFKEFITLMDRMVIDTDLACFITNMTPITEMTARPYDATKAEDRALLHSLIMTCSDLSDYTKPWEHCQEVGRKNVEQFFSKEPLDDAHGVFEVGDMMENREMKIHDLQIHFMETICEPVFKLLSALFPVTAVCHVAVQKNLEEWKDQREFLIREEEEEATVGEES